MRLFGIGKRRYRINNTTIEFFSYYFIFFSVNLFEICFYLCCAVWPWVAPLSLGIRF